MEVRVYETNMNHRFADVEGYKTFYVSNPARIQIMIENIIGTGETPEIPGCYDLAMEFIDRPIINPERRLYILSVDEKGYVGVLNSDTFCEMLVSGLVQPIER